MISVLLPLLFSNFYRSFRWLLMTEIESVILYLWHLERKITQLSVYLRKPLTCSSLFFRFDLILFLFDWPISQPNPAGAPMVRQANMLFMIIVWVDQKLWGILVFWVLWQGHMSELNDCLLSDKGKTNWTLFCTAEIGEAGLPAVTMPIKCSTFEISHTK